MYRIRRIYTSMARDGDWHGIADFSAVLFGIGLVAVGMAVFLLWIG